MSVPLRLSVSALVFACVAAAWFARPPETAAAPNPGVGMTGAAPAPTASAASRSAASRPSEGPVLLPVEVLSAGGPLTVDIPFSLAEAAGVDRLYLQVHRPSYRDASVNPARGPKASVRLNGGPWVGLTDANADALPHEAAYGGLAGAYGTGTIRVTVPLSRLGRARDGANTVSFRFNGTDGFTVGFRVLAFNLLRADGSEALPLPTFAQDDPAAWEAPRSAPADVAAGKRLWKEAPIVDGPGGAPIQATCGSCHARDGRDLWYFAYSNQAIEARSRFHGLSETEAEQIASYVRSLQDSDETYAYTPPGRPWNPPYQPGPGTDAKPVHEWAAGAGLEWVLDRDEDALDHLVAARYDGAPAALLADALATTSELNMRETPVPIQFPDWNAWLPEVHPVDVWGGEFLGHRAASDYEDAVETLTADRDGAVEWAATSDNGLEHWPLQRMFSGVTRFWRYDGAIDFGADPTAVVETKHRSLYHWASVKSWELTQEFDLEAIAPTVYGPYGEARSWIGKARPLFELAPHLATHKREVAFAHQSPLVGKYASTAWYQLQLVVNAGNGQQSGAIAPVDWNYHPDHIGGLHWAGGPAHPLRYLLSFAKMAQLYRLTGPDGVDRPEDRRTQLEGHAGVVWGQVHPGRLYSGLPDRGALGPPVLEAYLGAFMDWVELVEPDAWPRRPDTDGDGAYCDEPFPEREWLQPATWDGDTYAGPDPDHCDETWGGESYPSSHTLHARRHAQNWYWSIPKYRALGVSEPTLSRMIDWGEAVWPRGPWDGLRVGAPPGPTAYVLDLPEGWSTATLPFSLDGAALDSLFSATPALLLVKDVDGRVHSPPHGVDGLPAWDRGRAYRVFSTADAAVHFERPLPGLAELPVELRAGWNLLPYYPRDARPWREALAPALEAIDYLEDGEGGVYDRSRGTDTAGPLRPGRGYLVHLEAPLTFTYAD